MTEEDHREQIGYYVTSEFSPRTSRPSDPSHEVVDALDVAGGFDVLKIARSGGAAPAVTPRRARSPARRR